MRLLASNAIRRLEQMRLEQIKKTWHSVPSFRSGASCSLRVVALFLTLGFVALGFSGVAHAQAAPSITNPVRDTVKPLEFGLLVQGGKGFTQDRDAFKFIMAGVHAGKVLTPNVGSGLLRGNFEYAVEAFPFWQSYTPRFQRANCVAVPNSTSISCSPLYTVGGTFTGASITPIILRWNFAGTRRFAPWAQAAGGIIWTNHKYPAFGSTTLNLINDGPYSDASVWNFTPQGGVGVHYFIHPRRSIDFSANGVHISSSSLGDKNPRVNASVHFSLGYTWWK